MNCQQAKDMMFAYVKGELDAKMVDELRAHLDSCASCKSDLEDCQSVLSLMDAASDVKVIRATADFINHAIEDGASDIHLEPTGHGLRGRLRVDGVLHEHISMDHRELGAAIIARIKTMADMNLAERRVPQEGRIPLTREEKGYDLRVSTIPTIFGESVVIRILDRGGVLPGLDKLGLHPDDLATLRNLIGQPMGLLLVVGPTGSGRTTMLYSLLQEMNRVACKILTIEDPVEYQIDGAIQVAVNRKAGLTFANALRSLLRQDPDIIMVGEIRDLETMEIAIEASLTGHLVLSTLHTNDAPFALSRMVDMGVEPFLIPAAVIGVLAMRLARCVCRECRESYEVKASELSKFGFKPRDENEMVTLWRGRGCETCRQTGFKGRVGIYELMTMNPEIGELITRRAPLVDIKAAAKASGMRELREDGLLKVLEGVTTPEEVMRVGFPVAR